MPKIQTSDGYMLAKETIKGLPDAGKKVGGMIGKGLGKVMKAPFNVVNSIKNRIKSVEAIKDKENEDAQKKLRRKTIEDAIKQKDYNYLPGDELIYPGAKQYKQ